MARATRDTSRATRSTRAKRVDIPTVKKSDLQQTNEYNAKARNVLNLAGEKDPTVKKPSSLSRLFGVLDAPGTAVRGVVHNVISPDDVNIGAEVLKSLKGEDRIEGADIADDLGVENKWAKMGLGFLLDVALDPTTYLTFGTGNAAKLAGKGLIGRLATTGIGVDDLAEGLVKNLGDDAGRVAQKIVTQFGDDALDESGKLLAGRLSPEQSQKLMQDVFAALGDEGGVKFAGVSFGGQKSLSKAGYSIKGAANKSKLGTWLNRAFVHGNDADAYRMGNEAINAGLDFAKRQVSGKIANADKDAAALVREIATSVDDPTVRKHISLALGSKMDDPEVVGTLQDLYRAVAEAGDDVTRQSASDALASFRAGMFDPDDIAKTLRGVGIADSEIDNAVQVAVKVRGLMDEMLTKQRGAGLEVKDFPNYLPGVGELDTSKKALAANDDFLRGIGLDPASLRERPNGGMNDFLRANAPDVGKAKEYGSPLGRLEGRTLDDMVGEGATRGIDDAATGAGLRTELDVANLAGYAKNKGERNIALKEFQDDIAGVLRGLPIDEQTAAESLVKNAEKVFTNDEAMKGFMRSYDKVLNLWKRSATIYNPGFWQRNLLSNKFLMFTENVLDPKSEAASLRIMQSAAKGTLSEADDVLLREAIEDGAFTTARQLSEEVAPGQISKVGQVLGGVNEFVENQSRLSAYLTARNKMGRDGAGAMVDKALYSYNPALLTAFERNVMRRVMPFYVWSRRNAPHMAELIAKSPGKLTPIGHLTESGEAVSDTDKSVLPDWLTDLSPVPLPIKQDGNEVLLPTSGLLPIGEIGDALDILKGGPTKVPANVTREVIGRMPPLLKMPLELAFNKDIYFQDDITRYPGETRRAPGYVERFHDVIVNVPLLSDAWGILLTSVGGVEKTDDLTGDVYLALPAVGVKVMKDAVPWMNSVGKLLSDAPRQRNDLIKAITGVSSVANDQERFARQKAYDDEQRLRDQLRGLGLTTTRR